MNRRSLSSVLALAALLALSMFSSAALAAGAGPAKKEKKEKAVKTSEHYTAEYTEGTEYFMGDTLHCHGVHKTNSLLYPGTGTGRSSRGGEDIEHCKLSKGQRFPERWQIVGDPINIDGNEWDSDFDGQGTFDYTSKVTTDHSFWIRAIYTP